MRRTPTDTTHPRSRAPRTAFLVGAAIAAPMAAVGVASAVTGPSGADDPVDPSGVPMLAGDRVEPGGVPTPAGGAGGELHEPSPEELAAAEAFFAAGYAYCDAEALAQAQGTDVWQAKVGVGTRLQAGETVEAPSGCVDPGADPRLLAFWDHGYAYCDAVALGEALGVDPTEAKFRVGDALVSGEPVPAPPSGCTD